MAKQKSFHEDFAKFFEKPTREGLRKLLKNNIGELRTLDFKGQWLDHSSLSKNILGMANSGGGCLVVGVEEKTDKTFEPVGLSTLEDKANIINGIKRFIPNILLNMVDIVDFSYDASEYPKLIGKKFQVLFVEFDPSYLPFISMGDGKGIREAAIYVNRGGMTVEANHDELQKLLNTRIETGYSTAKEIDLKKHLDQLRVLLMEIPQYREKSQWAGAFDYLSGLSTIHRMMGIIREPNPKYPKENFEDFVLRMIELKKKRIAKELDVLNSHSS
jgi:predicted HTH transcriptional regulator